MLAHALDLVLFLSVASLAAEEPELVGASGVATVPGEEACVVGLNDGRLLRIDLASGELQAQARIPEADGPANLERTAGGALLTWSGWNGGRVVVRAWEDLAERFGYELGRDQRPEAWSPDGRRAVVSTRHRAPWYLTGVGLEPVLLGDDTRAVAFSPDGERLVSIGEGRGELRRVADGALLAGFPVRTHAQADDQDVVRPLSLCQVSFHGPESVLLAWAHADREGDLNAGELDLITLPEGELHATVPAPMAWGDWADGLFGDAALGRVALSLHASGYVVVYRDDDWTPVWSVDYGGGNPSGMRLERGGHPRWMGVSGMIASNSRVVDLVSGSEVVGPEVVAGMFHLTPSDSGRSLVGIRDVSLAVIDVEQRALRFARVENAEGLDHLERGPALDR